MADNIHFSGLTTVRIYSVWTLADGIPSNSKTGRDESPSGVQPALSAIESPVCGFSARISEIARACGVIRMLRGTGENHFRAARAHYAAKLSVGK